MSAFILKEFFKAVFFSFANGTYFRRAVPGAQIAADFASPDWQRQGVEVGI